MTLNPKLTNWDQRRVWIIGASAGIGAALATQLLQRGARVAISARSRPALELLAEKFPADRTYVLPLNVSDVTQIQAAHLALASAWGGYDLVIYSAGHYAPQRAWDLSLSTVQQMFAVNVNGVYACLSIVVPQLMAQASGGIAIVSSVAGYSGLPKGLVYGATKAALINLCEALYLDLAPKGIGVYLIDPGFVRTRLTAQNDFPMPALMEVDDAAHEIIKGLQRGQFEIHFPKRFSLALKFLRMLPYRWYFSLVGKITGL